MRICYVTASLPFGHGEIFILPEIQALLESGHEILVIPMYPRGTVYHTEAQAILAHTLSMPLFSFSILGSALAEFFRSPMRIVSALALLLRCRTPSALVRNIVIFPKGLWLARKLRVRKIDCLHAHWANTPSTLALIASLVSGVPWSLTAHRGDILENNLLSVKIEDAMFTRFICEDGVASAQSLLGPLADNNIVVLHLGVPVPCLVPETELTRHAVALCPAYLIERKGHLYLLEAVALLKQRGIEISLLLAGDGDQRNCLEKRVKELRISEEVQFLGQLSHQAILAYYTQGRVSMAVLPTLHEGIPVSLLEAMSYGVPVIGTKTGGIPELLEGGAGLLVPARDAEALASAMSALLFDPEKRHQMAFAGRRRVEEQYDHRVQALRLANLLQDTAMTVPGRP